MSDSINWERSLWSRRRLLTRVGAGVVGVAGASVLAACGKDDDSSAGSGGTSTAPYKMGGIITTTGALAGSIGPNFAGLNIAIKEVNAAGGIGGRQIALTSLDDQYQAAQEPVLLQRFASDKITNIAGPIGSDNVQAILPVATSRKILTVGWAKTDSQGDAAKYPYNFPLIYTATSEGTVLAKHAIKVGSSKFGILAEQSLFGQTLTTAAKTVFQQAGGGKSVASVVQFPFTATDMRPYLAKLQAAGVDAIGMFTVSGTAVAQAISAMTAMKFFVPIVTLVGPWSATTLKLLPPQLEDKAFANNYAVLSYDDQNPISDKVKAYAAKIAADPQGQKALAGAVTAPFYDWVYMVKNAIEKGGSDDSTKIKTYLESNAYDGVLGSYKLSTTSHNPFTEADLAVLSVVSLREPASMGGIFGKRAA